jgi:hypothetical protein
MVMALHGQRRALETYGTLFDAYYGSTTKREITEITDPRDSYTLAVIWVALVFASISMITSLLAFYWFVRMRRSFRQE